MSRTLRAPALEWRGGLRVAVFLLALAPLGRLVVYAFLDQLGANPLEALTRATGFWTLTLLCVTLAMTPLRHLTGQVIWIRMRRMLGLFTAAYASVHLLIYAVLDLHLDWSQLGQDLAKRPFMMVGFAAWLLLMPLAATSTRSMIRRLGRRWGMLHRTVYVIVLLGLLHFWWVKSGKNDFLVPLEFAVVIGLLLGYRVVRSWRMRVSTTTPR